MEEVASPAFQNSLTSMRRAQRSCSVNKDPQRTPRRQKSGTGDNSCSRSNFSYRREISNPDIHIIPQSSSHCCRTSANVRMGFWTRQPAAAKDSTAPIEAAAAAASQHDHNEPSRSQSSPSNSTTKSRDDIAEEEFSTLLKALQDEDTGRKEAHPQNFQDTLYPTTMSCREAFDELYFCYSLGGQFKNLYRYGTYRRCEDKSADFWFCMRTKMYGPNTKKEMIVKYHKEKEAEKYKRGPSSEDVWKVRTEPLEGQFMGTFGEAREKEAHEREI